MKQGEKKHPVFVWKSLEFGFFASGTLAGVMARRGLPLTVSN
jgi:hypothetical protein